MRTLVNWETVRSSPNSTPIVGFGRFPWMRNQNCSPPLSHHLDVFVLTDYHSVSALCQRSSNTLCPRYLRVRKGHSVRWMMSSFMGFTACKKLGWPLKTNVSFHDLQFDSLLTSLIALDFMQTCRPTKDHCCDPIPSPFRCRRDTAIHGDGKPSWEIHSPPGWPQWPPLSIITQRQGLGLGWKPAEGLWADQANISITDSPGALQSKPPNDHFSRCFQHRTWCGIISSSGWWTVPSSVLRVKISQWQRNVMP